ncbi:AP-5 complex subunit sigma-1-like isoform X2 [Nelusetta ayraudi]|uniref:AP-5 complex subunit sigma-1-like isoform X2 n=1 Tax=Nelusetta ayraudi TaxID=303726 RepID=UPI003F702818
MVRCFLVHTVCPLPSLGVAAGSESRLLYCRLFGPDEALLAPEQERELSPEERRLLRKEKVAAVARQVRSAVSLSRESCGGAVVEVAPGEEALAVQEAQVGVARLRAGQPFWEELSAVWLAVQSLSFTLVCEPHDNLLLAEGSLRTLGRLCLEQLHLLGPGSEVLLRSQRLDALLSRLLPHGQLLFLNHRFALSLEREAAAACASNRGQKEMTQ